MKSQYFILLLVVFFITSTNAAQLRASALRKSIDLDDIKVDTEKEPTDAMTDSSTEESATELEARMAKQTPDTEEEAKRNREVALVRTEDRKASTRRGGHGGRNKAREE